VRWREFLRVSGLTMMRWRRGMHGWNHLCRKLYK